jgi:hypothetical protein
MWVSTAHPNFDRLFDEKEKLILEIDEELKDVKGTSDEFSVKGELNVAEDPPILREV